MITLAPQFLLSNDSSEVLFIRQSASMIVHSILPTETVPFHWPDDSQPKTLRFRQNTAKCTWSGHIDISAIGMHSLKLFHSETGRFKLYRIDIRVHPDQPILMISIADESKTEPLFRIDNYTGFNLLVRQSSLTTSSSQSIEPMKRSLWGWTEPTTYVLHSTSSNALQRLFD